MFAPDVDCEAVAYEHDRRLARWVAVQDRLLRVTTVVRPHGWRGTLSCAR